MSILAMPLEIRQTMYAHLLASKEGLKPWERGVRRYHAPETPRLCRHRLTPDQVLSHTV